MSSETISGLIEEFQRLLDANIRFNHDVAFYASMMNMHPDSLSRRLRKETGMGAKAHINSRLHDLVETSLREGVPKHMIAKDLGFHDSSHLIHFIKRQAIK